MPTSAPVDTEPLVALVPAQPICASQLVASVDDHVSDELEPLTTEMGLALMLTVGGAGAAFARSATKPVPIHSRPTKSKGFRDLFLSIMQS